MLKRIIDIFIALPILIVTAPLLFITAILIRIWLGNPILFKQLRPGLQGKPFIIYKFRTMTGDKGKEGCLKSDAERLTRLGAFLRKTSIDELPQLLNVLKSDMSIVGPRPLLMEYLPLYSERQNRRHEVKPGITGWAQVNGRNDISWDEKFERDVWYVDNNNLLLDLRILWLTLIKVLNKDGINQRGNDTVDKFKGVDL